jgi:hypothetical protein
LNETTFILGAGVNQAIHAIDYLASPPMLNNFFQIALSISTYSNAAYTEKIRDVYAYIFKYWKKNKIDLSKSPFNLEECFTLIESQIQDTNYEAERNDLLRIQYKLKTFVAEVLYGFSGYAVASRLMKSFGYILFNQKPTIITFNYDDFIESVIEVASRMSSIPNPYVENKRLLFQREISVKEIQYNPFNWKRQLCYGVTFDEVQLPIGLPVGFRYVEGDRYYSHKDNKLYPWSILKLHGSLNWFRYAPDLLGRSRSDYELDLPTDYKNRIILGGGIWNLNDPPKKNGCPLDPLLVTPILYKKDQFDRELYRKILTPLWQKALEALSNCKRLVVIGYSFPPTDFHVRKLFLEAFEKNVLEELVVVNPDTGVVQTVKSLCHFDKPVIACKDLWEFINFYLKHRI